jgi:hypothetical protein
MRAAILMFVLVSASAIANEEVGHEQNAFATAPIEQTAAGAVYGQRLPTPTPKAVSIDAAAANLAEHAGKPAAFSGRITEVCQKQGCWVVLSGENDTFARVTMHGHAFGVPKDSKGPAVVYGTLSVKMLGDKEREHLKKDGASQVRSTELQIDALSVLIPKSA